MIFRNIDSTSKKAILLLMLMPIVIVCHHLGGGQSECISHTTLVEKSKKRWTSLSSVDGQKSSQSTSDSCFSEDAPLPHPTTSVLHNERI